MLDQMISSQLFNSNRWATFLESTASGLQLNLKLFIPGIDEITDTRSHLEIPKVCPACNESFPEINCGDLDLTSMNVSSEGLVVNTGTVLFPLRDGLMMIVRECSCRSAGPWPLIERGRVARKLITCFQATLVEGINSGQTAIEFSAFRQVNQIIASMFHGDSEAIRRALDLIVSAIVIMLDADSSWLQYQEQGEPIRIVKGNPEQAYVDSVAADTASQPPGVYMVPVVNQSFQGRLGVFLPAGHPRVLPLLSLMAEQCLIVLEINHLFRLVQVQTARILNAIDYAVLMADVNGRIIYINKTAGNLFGENCWDWLNSDAEGIQAPWSRYLKEKPLQLIQHHKELFRYRDLDYYLDWQLLPLIEVSHSGDGDKIAGWLVLANDKTGYYHSQEVGRQAEGFSNITSIIGPLAHQLHNPLAAAKGLLQLAHRQKEPEKRTGYIEMSLQEIDRMSLLVKEFFQLNRAANLNFELIDLQTLIRESTSLFERETFGTHVKVILELEPVPLIRADSNQITQVVLNLFRNALEAMTGRQGEIHIQLKGALEWVELSVRDNGPGLSGEVLKYLFQPFFSTKVHGIGLGLASVKAIVDNHKGRIAAANLTDDGAMFTILFPVHSAAENMLQDADVLLAIQKDAIRYPTEQVLQAMGFSFFSIKPSELQPDQISKHQLKILLTDQRLSSEEQARLEQLQPGIHGFFIGEPSEFITGRRWKAMPLPLDYGKLIEEIGLFTRARALPGKLR
ncbi:MAG TPA: ATP-binding protein [Bacillota bacterium]|nr:ATP-binding protein [Bacillota bacterium]